MVIWSRCAPLRRILLAPWSPSRDTDSRKTRAGRTRADLATISRSRHPSATLSTCFVKCSSRRRLCTSVHFEFLNSFGRHAEGLLPITPDRVLLTTMVRQNISLEGVARKRLRRGQVQDAIIGAVALSGILVVAIAAPNAARLFKDLNIASQNPAHRFRERISVLRKKGLLKWNCVHGTYTLELTRAGRDYAKRIHLRTIKISEPRKWDGMWRIVIF